MPQGNPKPGELYRHFKNKEYQILAIAHHSETDEILVVYQGLYAPYRVCARPYEMFISEVDHEKYPDVEQTWRFELIGDTIHGIYEKTMFAESTPAVAADDKNESLTEAADSPVAKAGSDTTGDWGETMQNQMHEMLQGNTDKSKEKEEPHVNPWLLKFMDAESLEEKYQVFAEMRPEITEKLIDDISVVCDMPVGEGSLEDRYLELKNCLKTQLKYEGTRLH